MARDAVKMLMLVTLGLLAGAAAVYWWQSREDALSVGSLIAGFERKNELTVFAAQVVPVVTSRDEGLVDFLDVEQTAIIPASVRYTIDMSQISEGDVAWNAETRAMTITAPPVMIQPPNLSEQRARYFRKGVWISADAAEGLYRLNSGRASRDARALARSPGLAELARTAARDAIARNAELFLRGAGYPDARVTVRFATDGEVGARSYMDSSRRIEDVLAEPARSEKR